MLPQARREAGKAPEHEVMKGMGNWTAPQSELYFINKAFSAMTALAGPKPEKTGKMETNIGVNEYGSTTTAVFATTIGHVNETMMQDRYMKMLTRGLPWAAGKPVAGNVKAGE